MMLVGQQIGPFKIERELGSGAMGAVYRGVYTKTGQRVAVKVMLPGMGDNEQAQKRFEREANILKQLNHPNIVRLFGVGKFQGMRYYAMEYVEGESLDRALARRGRLAWGEVVALGRQLCAALQHAHEKGVVHRDLKPSNLMVLADGTLKLTDFGIAKDLDVTQLTEANCTVGTASYMSPEQCRGERDLTHKSDLYSLGIVLYELLTGKKPFQAENVMDMFLAHVQGTFERPSRLVLDIPRWLDTLVCQLLEKQTERRPFDADAVGNALARVMEKFEAQQSAGVDAARARVADRLSGDTRPDAEDREAARTLLGPRKKRKKKVAREPFYRRTWFQAAGIAGLLAGLALVLYLLLKPPSADRLYRSIERLMAGDARDRKMAVERDGPIQQYLYRFGKNDDERTRQVRAWEAEVGVELAEEELEDLKKRVKVIDVAKMDALTTAEREALRASQAEDEGDLAEAARRWQQVGREGEGGSGHWADLARLREGQFQAVQGLPDRLERYFAEMREYRRQPEVEGELQQKAFRALRYERFGDLFEANRRWAALREELQNKPRERTWYLFAARKARATKDRLPRGESEKEARVAAAKKQLERAKQLAEANQLRDAEVICLDFQALYGSSPEFGLEEQVSAAGKLWDAIQKLRKG